MIWATPPDVVLLHFGLCMCLSIVLYRVVRIDLWMEEGGGVEWVVGEWGTVVWDGLDGWMNGGGWYVVVWMWNGRTEGWMQVNEGKGGEQ